MKTKTWAAAIGVLVIIAVAAGAVYLLSSRPSGTLAIGVKDSPLPSNVTHIYLSISGIILQGEGNSTTSYKVNSTQFDLLKLYNITKFLGSDSIPVGNYTMFRFNVTSAVATIGGVNQTLNVPSGQVKAPEHFQVAAGKTTSVVLDISVTLTHISASWNLRPVLTTEHVTGPS